MHYINFTTIMCVLLHPISIFNKQSDKCFPCKTSPIRAQSPNAIVRRSYRARLMTARATTSRNKRTSTRVNRRECTAPLGGRQRAPAAKLHLTSSGGLYVRIRKKICSQSPFEEDKGVAKSFFFYSLTILRWCRRPNCVIGCLSWLVPSRDCLRNRAARHHFNQPRQTKGRSLNTNKRRTPKKGLLSENFAIFIFPMTRPTVGCYSYNRMTAYFNGCYDVAGQSAQSGPAYR